MNTNTKKIIQIKINYNLKSCCAKYTQMWLISTHFSRSLCQCCRGHSEPLLTFHSLKNTLQFDYNIIITYNYNLVWLYVGRTYCNAILNQVFWIQLFILIVCFFTSWSQVSLFPNKKTSIDMSFKAKSLCQLYILSKSAKYYKSSLI